jgi:hypothetical protein
MIRLEQVRGEMLERFERVDRRFAQNEQRLGRMDQRMGEIADRIEVLRQELLEQLALLGLGPAVDTRLEGVQDVELADTPDP